MRWMIGGRSFGILALLFGLIAAYGAQSAEAQVTFIQITNNSGWGSDSPSVNADGTRIAFVSHADLTGSNPDGNQEIFLWTQGAGITQITNTTWANDGGHHSFPSINADGTRIAFLSHMNLTGGNPDGNPEIFLWTQNSGITQITNTTGHGIWYGYSINANGTRIAFTSENDLTGGNPYRTPQIFLWTQGAGLSQITNSIHDWSTYPSISADGTRIAFRSDADLTGGNSDGKDEIFLWTQGSGFTQITSSTQSTHALSYFLAISANGTRIALVSDLNLTGGNPDGSYEIFLWTQGIGISQLTDTTWAENFSQRPSINADGTRIAFVSRADLAGGNPHRRGEIFLWTQGSGFIQVTSSAGGLSEEVAINTDGTRIAFSSSSNPTSGNDHAPEIFLANLTTVTNAKKRVVILVHGIFGDPSSFGQMGPLLESTGKFKIGR